MSDQNGTPNAGGLDEGALPIRLLHDRVLVSTDNEPGERRSSAGIVIPATVAIGRRLAWGQVVAVGTNVRTVKPTDRVLFDPEEEWTVRAEDLHSRSKNSAFIGHRVFGSVKHTLVGGVNVTATRIGV